MPTTTDRPTTSAAQVRAYQAALPQVHALRRRLEPRLQRESGATVPRDTVRIARSVLRLAWAAVSRESGPALLPLHGAPSFGELVLRLDLAAAALDSFRERYEIYEEETDEDVWQVAAGNMLREIQLVARQLGMDPDLVP